MKKKKVLQILCLMMLGVLTLNMIGCQKDTSVSDEGKQTLIVGEMWNISGIDPASQGTLMMEKAMVTETLVNVKPNFELEAGLATEWQRLDDQTWKITLRKGVKFHDGTPMNADIVKWSLTRAVEINPQLQTITKIKSIKTEGENILIVTTTEPNGDFPASLRHANTSIIAESSLDKDGNFLKPVGTGSFKLEEWNPSNGEIRMAKFEEYWGNVSELDYLIIRPLPDPNTRALALEKGEIDFICDPPYNELERLGKQNLQVELHPTARAYVAEMNLNQQRFNDLRVRQAISYAIDRESIAKHVLFGTGTAAKGPFMPGMAWTNENLKGQPYNVAKAKQLLEEAGWVDTNGDGIVEKEGKPFEITLMTYPQRPGLPPMAQAMQAQLKEVGIDVKTEVMEFSAISEIVSKGKWDMKLTAYATAMVPTPNFYLQARYHSDYNKDIGYHNQQVNKLIEKCMAVDDQKEKFQIAKELQQILEDELPMLTIAYYGVAVAMKNNVENYEFNPTAHDYMLTTEVRLKE